jgi:hypothetical protein
VSIKKYFAMAPEPSSRLIDLQRQEVLIRELLSGDVINSSRPQLEEILRGLQQQIEQERKAMAAGNG